MKPQHLVAEPVDRTRALYHCPSQHSFTRVFAADVHVPVTWDCPHCGKTAVSGTPTTDEPHPVTPTRTHWDMLLERRSLDDLSRMLAERVSELRDC